MGSKESFVLQRFPAPYRFSCARGGAVCLPWEFPEGRTSLHV